VGTILEVALRNPLGRLMAFRDGNFNAARDAVNLVLSV